MRKLFAGLFVLILSISVNVSYVSAHAVVKPAETGVGSFTDFSVGVPSEKEVSTVKVKLFLPEGLNHVSPVVKPGWTINVISKENGEEYPGHEEEEHSTPTAIEWTAGQIPAEQKDFFLFSAQVPSAETELVWKIEQSYADGSVVSWSVDSENEQPKDAEGKADFSKFGPASKTKIINDLKKNDTKEQVVDSKNNIKIQFLTGLSLAAVGLSAAALVLQFRRHK